MKTRMRNGRPIPSEWERKSAATTSRQPNLATNLVYAHQYAATSGRHAMNSEVPVLSNIV